MKSVIFRLNIPRVAANIVLVGGPSAGGTFHKNRLFASNTINVAIVCIQLAIKSLSLLAVLGFIVIEFHDRGIKTIAMGRSHCPQNGRE